ncbi:oxidoreductase [Azorhizobium oxalatiphilum]|uniref:Oxidoreductase n=1 Tax=Azorhizobium oxalatiphilum TaxID=980631 RepID=A0A917BXJ2_9HYPH|nr:oxidoreductase [Azorhizobium oxalatiphilum]GGF62336.1 oxidoreductase [Azorhizobium oxalatiphilum]
MSDRKVRVGLVGYGFAGRIFHAPLIRAVEGLDLVAVTSSDAFKVRADMPDVAVHATMDTMLAEIDLVVVATPNDTHAPLARAALAAGKHVVIDKPFALDVAESRALIGAAEEKGLLLSVFHNRRWDSDYLSVKKAIEAGAIGRVAHFESRFERFHPEVRDRWRERGTLGSGLWFDLGPHLVDQALQLFGLPDRVFADIANLRDGALTDDWAHAVLHYPGLRVVIQCGLLCAGGTQRFIIHGTGGSLLKTAADVQEAQLRNGLHPGEGGWGQDPDALIRFDAFGERHTTPAVSGDQRQFYAGIAKTLLHGAAFNVRPIECLAVMAVIEAGFTSAREARAVELPLTALERASW